MLIPTHNGEGGYCYSRVVRKIVVASLLAPAIAIAAKPDASSARKTGDVVGQVHNCGDNAGIVVYLPGTSFDARTDAAGRFTISYVQPGTHELVVASRAGDSLGGVSSLHVDAGRVTDLGSLEVCADADGDGFSSAMDCDDNDASVHPGAAEVCFDGRDNDCDLAVDEDCQFCPAGETDCNGSCADTETDVHNCGGCGFSCGAGQSCDAGQCTGSSGPVCGDGVLDATEECDDGNTRDFDGCSSTCELPRQEVCDGQDNDFDGLIDNNPVDAGDSCFTDSGQGTTQCVNGELICR